MEITAENYGNALHGRGITSLGLRLRTNIVERWIIGDSLLDVGCADGTMLRILSPRFKIAFGIDANALSFPNKGRNIISARAESLPFADNSFDTIVCSATRKHVRDPMPVVREMARVLRRNGRLIIVDPNPLLVRIGMILGKFDPRYIRNNSWCEQIRREVESFGLRTLHASNGLIVQCVAEKP